MPIRPEMYMNPDGNAAFKSVPSNPVQKEAPLSIAHLLHKNYPSLSSFLIDRPEIRRAAVIEATYNFGNRTIQEKRVGEAEVERRLYALDIGMQNVPVDERLAFFFFEYWQENPVNAIKKFGIDPKIVGEILTPVMEDPTRYDMYIGFSAWLKEVQEVVPDTLTNPDRRFSELDYWIAMQITDPENLASCKTLRQIAADMPTYLWGRKQTQEERFNTVDNRADKLRRLGLIPDNRLDAQAEVRIEKILQLKTKNPAISLDEMVAELNIPRSTIWSYIQRLRSEGKLGEQRKGRRPVHSKETNQLLATLTVVISELSKQNLRWEFGEIGDELLATTATKTLGRLVTRKEIATHIGELHLPPRTLEAIRSAKIAEIRRLVIEENVRDIDELTKHVPYAPQKMVRIVRHMLQEAGVPAPRYLRS